MNIIVCNDYNDWVLLVVRLRYLDFLGLQFNYKGSSVFCNLMRTDNLDFLFGNKFIVFGDKFNVVELHEVAA